MRYEVYLPVHLFGLSDTTHKNKDISRHIRNNTGKNGYWKKSHFIAFLRACFYNSNKLITQKETFEDFKSLAGITDRDELMSAVAQVPEEDLRTALFLTLLACGKNIEINNELWRREHKRANKAEAMLKSKFPDD